MKQNSKKTGSNAPADKAPNRMPLLLVAVAVAVGGVAVYFLQKEDKVDPFAKPNKPDQTQSQQVLERAKANMASGLYDSAARLMETHLKLHADDTEIWLLLAQAYIKQFKLEQAVGALNQCIDRQPNAQAAQALWLKGAILAMVNRRAEAMQFFRQAAQNPQADADIFAKFGMELIRQTQMQWDNYGETDFSPGTMSFLPPKGYAEAESYFRKAYDAGSRGELTLAGLGQLAYYRGEYPQAEEFLSQATKGLSHASLWQMLGDSQRRQNKLDQAAATLEKGIAGVQSGDKAVLNLELGKVRAQQNQAAPAAEAFAYAADRGVGLPDSAVQAAQSYFQTGKFAMAMKYIDQAAELAPADEQVIQWRKKIEDARFGE